MVVDRKQHSGQLWHDVCSDGPTQTGHFVIAGYSSPDKINERSLLPAINVTISVFVSRTIHSLTP